MQIWHGEIFKISGPENFFISRFHQIANEAIWFWWRFDVEKSSKFPGPRFSSRDWYSNFLLSELSQSTPGFNLSWRMVLFLFMSKGFLKVLILTSPPKKWGHLGGVGSLKLSWRSKKILETLEKICSSKKKIGVRGAPQRHIFGHTKFGNRRFLIEN